MINSMTGYGKATREINGCLITAEIKSVNSKSFELNLKLPAVYRHKEQDMRTLLSTEIERGKADASISFDNLGDAKTGALNKKLIKAYVKDLMTIGKELKIKNINYLQIALSMPNAMSLEKSDCNEDEWKEVELLTCKAIKEFQSFRANEGNALEKDLLLRIKNIHHHLKETEKFEPQRMTLIRTRLSKMLSGQDDSLIDKNRFEQELIYYLEKLDITEEKVRLKTHCDYFLETMKEKTANGKKLGFIIQEIGREINTIGSKANDADMQRHVVEMKDDLEKMKEQLANVL
ncbi:MAG TPA: YicC/YloC family endoribonuclease [Bacteroidia bacterium]|nr:YicC/YloC family endoribonuclease [Bacteroidia bacterium]